MIITVKSQQQVSRKPFLDESEEIIRNEVEAVKGFNKYF